LNDNANGALSDVINGIDKTIQHGGIEVMNLSIAGNNPGAIGTCSSTTDPLYAAICRANAAGILVVAAAGNSGVDAGNTVPAKYPNVMTVANLADYDGQGGNDSLNGTSNYGSVVNIAAPGTQIYS